jgi:Rho GTPase-activating protein 1
MSETIYAPYASGRRAFAARQPFPTSSQGNSRFPRVLRESTNFILLEQNIVSEGLFRVPPHSKLRDVLKEAYDRGQKYIVWKDNGTTLTLPQYPRAEHQDEIIAELDPKDAYSVYMAAALIKAWYADLRQPIFPVDAYTDMKRLYGDPDDLPDLEKLKDLLSPSSEWSFLPAISREIIVRHLLPLLSEVAGRQETNKMTAENLAVCFAPALLCGPDQLEDAKMSSIIRRILAEAIDLWSQGLRKACEVEERAFEEDLRLQADMSDWDDPVEGKNGTEKDFEDEHQITGIILQDNERHPPPLPPRSQAPVASGRSFNDPVTRRKPAPPLQVPPRYSTIISDRPDDFAESPASYAAVTDGFAPPRQTPWDVLDEKKSGMNAGGDFHPPQIVLPKRKALTAEQIDSAESAITQIEAHRASDGRVALPGLGKVDTESSMRNTTSPITTWIGEARSAQTTSNAKTVTISPIQATQSATEFRRPSWSVSANRALGITSLARPVFPPTYPLTDRPASKSASLPVPGPKPRTPSPGLLQRMPTFETSKTPPTLAPPGNPRKINMKKASVDDLRRLYEERAGTAKTLVEAGRRK